MSREANKLAREFDSLLFFVSLSPLFPPIFLLADSYGTVP